METLESYKPIKSQHIFWEVPILTNKCNSATLSDNLILKQLKDFIHYFVALGIKHSVIWS